jgi:anthranilate synthase component 1
MTEHEHYPSRKEFVKKAKSANIIPVYKEIRADLETPVSAFLKVEKGQYGFLLESVEGQEKVAHYSFLGANPSCVFKAKGRAIEISYFKDAILVKKESFISSSDPLEEVKKLYKKFTFAHMPGLPRFCGGFLGYVGYDTVRFFERLPQTTIDDLDMPDIVLMLADSVLVFDHIRHSIKIIHCAAVRSTASAHQAYDEALRAINSYEQKLKAFCTRAPRTKARVVSQKTMRSNVTKKEFENMVRKAKRFITNGDIIQTVLSQRFEADFKGDAFALYRALRAINPSPYMYYLKLGDMTLVGSSPEVMVRCEGRRLELRPIAGTRPRGKDETDDRRLEKELLRDPKEKAEHIMLVDLGRNDLGRVADFGTVKVSEFMTIERYSHVMHIVSNVTARLSRGKDLFDVIRASFPAGTVSGAPKVRAMEIIEALEKTRRATYAGLIGYISFSGNLDSCIAIRTMLLKDEKAYLQVGAGIVADSVPAREYQETINKAHALKKALAIAQRGL